MSNFFSPSASATSSSTSSSSRSVPSDVVAKPLTAASASPHNILLRCPSPPVHPQSHTAFLIPLCRCCHIHQYPNLCSPQHHLYLLPRPSTSTSTPISVGHGGPISESSSNRSFSTDPYSYTTDCSPRSVIRHVYSSSSGPSPGPGFSNLHSTYCMGASGEVAKKKCHIVVGASISMIDNQHSTLNDESRSVVLGSQDRHFLMQGHPSILAQWNSSAGAQNEEFTHTRQGGLSANSEGRLSITHLQNSSRIYHNAESEKVSVQDSRLTKIPMQEQKCILTSGSAQTEKNGGIESLSATMGLNRSDVTGVRHGAGECYSEVQCSGIQDRKESDAERDSATNTHLRWPGVLVATSDAPSNKIQGQNHGADQRQRMSQPCSLNSDLQDDEGNSPGLWMRDNAVVAISTANGTSKCSDPATSKSTDALLGYVDGMRTSHHHHHHHHPRARQRNTLGSKWEDAERWLRPAAQQHHQSMACRRLIPRFGLLRMSDCLNTGTSALQPHSFQPMPVDLNFVADHIPLHSSCACWKYESLCSCKHAVLSSTHTHDGCGSSAPSKEPETVIGHVTSSVSKPSISVDCFDVDLINHKLNMSSPKDHVADQNMRGQIPNDPHAQKYCIEKIDQSNDYITSTEPIGECGEPGIPRPLPRPTNYGIVTPFTDKFVNAKTLPCLSTHLAHVTSNDQDFCTRLSIQDRIAMPMVSLRDVGTQISSVDGSGSISRYTSQNGSPSRHSGVLVMPKTTTVSLWGCGKNSRHQVMEDSSTSGKQWEQPLVQSIDLRDLAEQHRLRLELQARLSAEQHSRFSSSSSLSSYSSHRGITHHRTTSNWSSREVEEADLSRSLRHSTAGFEDESTSGPVHGASRNRCNEPLPCSASSSWSTWDEGPARVARLQEEEERIQAWETKIKSKADAKLKKLEENLAKKRSQTTMKIKERLAVAQRKVEEMRANVYSHQGRSTKKGRNHPRSFSLSPLSRCTCFSAS